MKDSNQIPDLGSCVVYDISPVLCPDTAVWPGDTRFSTQVSVNFDQDNHYLLSSMHTTLHVGAHTDAPSHYHKGAKHISECSLTPYLGKCQVVTVELPKNERILPKHLKVPIHAQRILFRTLSFADPNVFNTDFVALSAELIDHLAQLGVILVGIDTPSVDLFLDRDLESHLAIERNKMGILEGVILKDIPDGLYNLIALPLKIKNGDASPVRAVLIQ